MVQTQQEQINSIKVTNGGTKIVQQIGMNRRSQESVDIKVNRHNINMESIKYREEPHEQMCTLIILISWTKDVPA